MAGSILMLLSCNSNPGKEEPENSHTRGTIKIVSDEAFKPLLSTTVETFEAIYPNAHIEVGYIPQELAIRDLLEGKTDVAITGRTFTKAEEDRVVKRGRTPKVNKIASDALVFIVSRENGEQVITEERIAGILSGTINVQLVCDKSNSGNLLYLKKRFNQSEELKNIAAAGNDSAVIEYVISHPKAIGMIGMTLVSDYDDPKVRRRLKKVNLLSVQYKDSTGKQQEGYPVQAELITGKYPFIRDIFILNLDGQKNLGTGFANYLAGEDGQRIILKSGLMPFKMPTRNIIINKQ
jgi:phosphate transport system substrate-binding protein